LQLPSLEEALFFAELSLFKEDGSFDFGLLLPFLLVDFSNNLSSPSDLSGPELNWSNDAANTSFIVESVGADTKEKAVMTNAVNNILILDFMFLYVMALYIADKVLRIFL
jgi:hypothetical protein